MSNDKTTTQCPFHRGNADEIHQRAEDYSAPALTTNQGLEISDNQNSLHMLGKGPTLLEDFILREKITHFDHERIPERIVHARGSAAHGYFELTESLAEYTTAKVLTEVGKKTPMFARISTVAGGAGSVDTPRDIRGFALKFYTEQGNWDIVGNNVPVFFIQDAIKFPDLIHAVKMEPDRGFPQAASAHDTFWDFVSLMPESMHTVMWVMSDRAIPRSLRMIEGFGVHSFRLINAEGKSTFVKFHWRPKLGVQSTLWDEAVKIAGADPDYHRRDLFEAITQGHYPEWEFAVQLFTEEQAAQFPFDHLDPTKLIPEELVPLKVIGRFVLNKMPDNFFAETEQVAFCPANIVQGIDFSNDPLLQGRLFSYLDTQLSRLGGPNFQQIPINAPKCPFANQQRDGHMQMQIPKGRVAYEPSSLEPQSPKATTAGFASYTHDENNQVKGRVRPESFADHYSQARQFYCSQTPEEQRHIQSAYAFELSKVETLAVRERMISHLLNIDQTLAKAVAEQLNIKPLPKAFSTATPATDQPVSPALQTIGKMQNTLQGRTVGILIANKSNAEQIHGIQSAAEQAGAIVKIIALKTGDITLSDGSTITADGKLAGMPSVILDAVALVLMPDEVTQLKTNIAAISFINDAYYHCKAIAHCKGSQALLDHCHITKDAGIIPIEQIADFITAAKQRFYQREP